MPISIDAAKLKSDLTLHDFSTRVLARTAALDGIRNAAQTQLDAAFRGDKAMEVESLRKVCALWDEVKEMMTCFLPFKLDTATGERVHSQLLLYRKSVMEGALQFLGINNSGGETTGPADNIQTQG